MYLTVLIIDMLLYKGSVENVRMHNIKYLQNAKIQNNNPKAFLSINQLMQCDP